MTRHYFCLFIAVMLIAAVCGGCKSDNDSPVGNTDYSNPDNWLLLPKSPMMQVDIFFIYPTVFQGGGDAVYAQIDDPVVRAAAAAMIPRSGAAFETVGNMYCPYYRQVSLTAAAISAEELHRLSDATSGDDIFAAFDHYISHFNNGRPFILAGFSQGSIQVIRTLLMRYMATHTDVYERMIAAYAIGYSVTRQNLEDYPHLRFATGADDTGVIISYNTEMLGMTGLSISLLPNSVAINPVNWRTDDTPASAGENLASRIPDKVTGNLVDISDYADAQLNLDRGTVMCSTVDPDENILGSPFPYGCYHHGDYGFYFYSIRKNAEDRVKAYLK